MQQVLQDVEQLFEAQVRTTSVQVSLVSIRCVQGLHSTCPSGRTTLQGHVTEHLNLPLRAFSDPRLIDAVSDCLNSRRSFLVPACSSSGNGFRIDDETTGVERNAHTLILTVCSRFTSPIHIRVTSVICFSSLPCFPHLSRFPNYQLQSPRFIFCGPLKQRYV